MPDDLKMFDEDKRIASLEDASILDTHAEESFDAITRAAALICGTPIALVSLVHRDRQWFKSVVGLEARETPRAVSFCDHAMRGDDIFEIPDAQVDPRFAANALVTGAPNIRFYAGAPLVSADDQPFGALCVIDRTPRELSDWQKAALHELSKVVMHLIEARRTEVKARGRLDTIVAEQARTLEALTEAESRFRGLFATASHGMALVSLDGRFVEVNAALCTMLGYTEVELLATDFQTITYHVDLSADLTFLERLLAGEIPSYQMEKRYLHKDGRILWVLLAVSLVRGADNAPRYFVAQIQDWTANKRLEEARKRGDEQFKRLIQGVTDFGIFTLSPEGRITSWNTGAERITGYPTSKVAGQHFRMFLTAEDIERGESEKILSTATRDGRFEGAVKRQKSDGTLYWAHVVLNAVRDSDRQIIGFTAITRDIDVPTDT